MTGSSTTYRASDHQGWEAAGLKDFGDFSDSVEYRNERESGWGDLQGDWFYGDDDALTIYFGSHGNDHSPGASSYTYAEVFEHSADYRKALAVWENAPEDFDEDVAD